MFWFKTFQILLQQIPSKKTDLLSPREQKENEVDQDWDEKWDFPLRKPLNRNVLNVSSSSEAAAVDGDESEATDQLLNGFFCCVDVPGIVHLYR